MSSTPYGMSPSGPPPDSGSSKRGCLIAAIAAIAVGLVACVGGLWYVGTHATSYAANKVKELGQQAEATLPADAPADLKPRFETALSTYSTAMASLTPGVPPPANLNAQLVGQPMTFLMNAFADKKLSVDEAEQFITLVNQAVGSGTAPAAPGPAPSASAPAPPAAPASPAPPAAPAPATPATPPAPAGSHP